MISISKCTNIDRYLFSQLMGSEFINASFFENLSNTNLYFVLPYINFSCYLYLLYDYHLNILQAWQWPSPLPTFPQTAVLAAALKRGIDSTINRWSTATRHEYYYRPYLLRIRATYQRAGSRFNLWQTPANLDGFTRDGGIDNRRQRTGERELGQLANQQGNDHHFPKKCYR